MSVAAAVSDAVGCVASTLGYGVLCVLGAFVAFWVLNKVLWSSKVDSTFPNGKARHVVITGCDSGFGRMLALRLHAQGFHVHAGCLLPKSAVELSQTYGPRYVYFVDLLPCAAPFVRAAAPPEWTAHDIATRAE